MKQRAHYIRLYKRLELNDSASFEMLRLNFRRLATLYHPDKSNDLNTQQFQDIQTAYHELKKYYSKHGRLPLGGTEEFSTPEIDPIRASSNPKIPRFKLSSALYVLMTLIFLILLFIPPQGENTPTTVDNQSEGKPVNSKQITSTHTPEEKQSSITTKLPPIELGMRMGKIFEILGVPTDSVGDHWYYGNSTIFFRDGRVIGWHLDPNSPIRIQDSQPRIVTPPARVH